MWRRTDVGPCELVRSIAGIADETETLPNVIALDKLSLRIGSAMNGNDIRLDHPYMLKLVSRLHAKFERKGSVHLGASYLTDTGSTNGTFLNGAKLRRFRKYKLRQGDHISFGDRLVEVENHYVPNIYAYVYQKKTASHPEPRSEPTCGDCAKGFVDPHYVVPCGHVFCHGCLDRCMRTENVVRCPSCSVQPVFPFAIRCIASDASKLKKPTREKSERAKC
jgi:hypothetical protein